MENIQKYKEKMSTEPETRKYIIPDKKQKSVKLIKWECLHCGGIYTSDPKIRHSMDVCSCGKSAIDAEEFYTRIIGDKVKFLN